MRKLLVATMAMALGATSMAALADDGNVFVNGNIGQSNYHVTNVDQVIPGANVGQKKRDTAGALRVGYRWRSVVDYGVEVGYGYLGQATWSTSNDDGTGHLKQKSRGWLLGGNLNYNITDNWYVSARAGWYRSRNSFQGRYDSADGTVVGALGNYTGTGEYLGAGFGYNFNKHFSLGANYDQYHSRGDSVDERGTRIGLFSLGGEYRF
ncbi:MAG: outer membrane beta-barrel protein [Rhodanobacter sp.]